MKKQDERKADSILKQLGVTPRIYHFESGISWFGAITIAEETLDWIQIRSILNTIIGGTIVFLSFGKAVRLRAELRKRNIYGVSICDLNDSFNRRLGRTIAKGRLAKHLARNPRGDIVDDF